MCSSSQQEDEDLKERHVSVPDILRSWAAASPQEVMLQSSELPQRETQVLPHQAEAEKEEEQTPAEEAPVADGAADEDDEAQGDVGVTEADALFKILKLPVSLEELLSESIRENQPSASMEEESREELLRSFQQPQKLLHNQTNPQAESSEVTAYQSFVDSFHMRRMNESIWSVESLAPFVPSKESLQQSGLFEPRVLAESTEQEENHGAVRLNSALKASTERRRSLRFSSSDSLLLSDNMIVFSTPALQQSGSQEQRMESEGERGESVKEQSSTPSENPSSAPPPRLQRRIILSPPTREEADEDRSSEPEAPQSPNQESLTPPEQEKSSSEQEQTLLMSTAEEEEKPSPPSRLILKDGEDGKSEDGAGESAEVRESQLSVPAAQQTTAASPSRGNLVDSGVQCGLMEQHQCVCEKSSYGPNKRQQLKYQGQFFHHH